MDLYNGAIVPAFVFWFTWFVVREASPHAVQTVAAFFNVKTRDVDANQLTRIHFACARSIALFYVFVGYVASPFFAATWDFILTSKLPMVRVDPSIVMAWATVLLLQETPTLYFMYITGFDLHMVLLLAKRVGILLPVFIILIADGGHRATEFLSIMAAAELARSPDFLALVFEYLFGFRFDKTHAWLELMHWIEYFATIALALAAVWNRNMDIISGPVFLYMHYAQTTPAATLHVRLPSRRASGAGASRALLQNDYMLMLEAPKPDPRRSEPAAESSTRAEETPQSQTLIPEEEQADPQTQEPVRVEAS